MPKDGISVFLSKDMSKNPRGGGPLVFIGGYHARVQKHGKRVVFQGEASAARPVFRVSKTAKIKKKGMFFKAK